MFKKISTLLVFGLIIATSSNAQDETKASSSSTIYIHPISLVLSGIPDFKWITLTFERNFTPGKSLLIRPIYMYLKQDETSVQQFSVGIGLRNYMSKPNSGVYFDLIGHLGGASIELEDDQSSESADGSGLFFAGLGHIGVKKRWDKLSLMVDVGGGYQYIAVNVEDSRGNEAEAAGGSPALDINFGVGFHF